MSTPEQSRFQQLVLAVAHRPALRAVVRPVTRAVNTPLAKTRTGRALAGAPRPLKVEIGGIEQRPGWVVTNVNAVARNYLDATVRWPIEDGGVSHVYADNVIEHITLDQGRAMLAEAFRCLAPGGRIRLVTPDIRAHVELYLQGRAAVDGAVGDRYRAKGRLVAHPVDLVRIPIGDFGHHLGYVYDFETLAAELESAGFRSPRQYEPNTSDDPVLADLEQRGGHGEAQLVVEAVR